MVIRDVLNSYLIADLILHRSSMAALKPGETKMYPLPESNIHYSHIPWDSQAGAQSV